MGQQQQDRPNWTGRLVVLALSAGALLGCREGNNGSTPALAATKTEVEASAEFGRPGDVVLGNPDAPVTLVEYASLTCSHCAAFKKEIFPVLQEKFIDTGLVKYTMREFPIGGPAVQALATQAFMVARCKGDEHYYKIAGYLFENQKDWAYAGTVADAARKLKEMSRNFGITEALYNECTTNSEELERIQAVANQGEQLYEITGTPAFVINGKPLTVAYNSMRRATHMEWNGNRYDLPRDAERMTQILNDALPEDKRVK